ncbi:MAG: hypothetical protein ACYDBB_15605 [Armatimonadota bacterium]
MQKAHLCWSWGRFTTLLMLTGVMTLCAYAEDVTLIITNKPFGQVLSVFANNSGIKLNVLDNAEKIVTLNLVDATPEKVLEQAAKSQGLDFWRQGDTYFIGKRPDMVITAVPPRVNPSQDPPASSPGVILNPPTPLSGGTDTTTTTSVASRDDNTPESVVRKILLQHISVPEFMHLVGNYDPRYNMPTHQRKSSVDRFETLVNPRRPRYDVNRYLSPGLSSPWLSGPNSATNGNQARSNSAGITPAAAMVRPVSGSVTRNRSVTDRYQLFPGPNPNPNPGPGVNPNPNPNPGPGLNPNDPNAANGAGGLASFLPKGIQDILGLTGLNAILVKADSEESIDQLEQLIKLLDQAPKQVIIEVMFVQMTVEDALSMGVSFEWAGMPWSLVSQNGGTEGNFSAHYIRGNLRAALATQISNKRAKVVNAPRIITQNGYQGAYFMMEDSIPFILSTQDRNVFGDTIENSDIQSQTFQQGLTVNMVTIHPDDSVTLDVTPMLESPANAVPIPGSAGAGDISGSTSSEIQTIVRVKNGETIMMGGFVSKNEGVGSTKAPLLSELPIIGPLLFQAKNKSTNNTETLVFLTPTVMKDDETNFEGMRQLPPLW